MTTQKVNFKILEITDEIQEIFDDAKHNIFHLTYKQVLFLINIGKINIEDEYGNTLLHWCSQSGDMKIFMTLLEGEFSSEIKPDINKNDPLLVACNQGRIEIVRELLKRSANVNVIDEYEIIPLDWACKRGHIEMAEMLLDHGAEVEYCKITGKIIYDIEDKIPEEYGEKVRNFFDEYAKRSSVKPAKRC